MTVDEIVKMKAEAPRKLMKHLTELIWGYVYVLHANDSSQVENLHHDLLLFVEAGVITDDLLHRWIAVAGELDNVRSEVYSSIVPPPTKADLPF